MSIKGMMPVASTLLNKMNSELQEDMEWERGLYINSDPIIRYGEASEVKNKEDFTLVNPTHHRVLADGSSTSFAVFGVLDGHNGASAAEYAKENLVADVLASLPSTIASSKRNEWLTALPGALKAGFQKTDEDFKQTGQTSGTTVTLVIIDGWSVTVASVGDSRCVLVPQDGRGPSTLTVDHRLEVNEEERARVMASGAQLARLILPGGIPVGPLRCWPGGLSLSRSIGDFDVGEFIVPTPDVKQFQLDYNTGARLIIASDGVWDALGCDRAVNCCKKLPAELAARRIVKESVRRRGLRDDTTCIVVDLVPPLRLVNEFDASGSLTSPAVAAVPKRKRGFRKALSLQYWRWNVSSSYTAQLVSTSVVERCHRSNPPASNASSCATCHAPVVPLALPDAISVHAGSFFSVDSGAPIVLCVACKKKRTEGQD